MRRLGYQPVGHEGGFRSDVRSPFLSLLKTFGFAPKHMDLEYFARIAARFPLVAVESPRIVEYRLHGANYQFQTWRQTEFYDQFEELQRSIISYAGIRDEKLKQDILVNQMVSNLFYVPKLADRIGDQRLVRQVAKYCQRFRPRLTVRQTVTSYIAAITGRCPRLHRVKRLGSRSARVE
jgi:hypothetical protein